MWGELVTLVAMGLIQDQDFGTPWVAIGVIAGLISLAWLSVGGFVGVLIASSAPKRPLLKGALAGIGAAACAGIVVIIAFELDTIAHSHAIPTIRVGVVVAAVAVAVIIIWRMGRNAG